MFCRAFPIQQGSYSKITEQAYSVSTLICKVGPPKPQMYVSERDLDLDTQKYINSQGLDYYITRYRPKTHLLAGNNQSRACKPLRSFLKAR